MYIEGLEVAGLVGVDEAPIPLGRVERIAGPWFALRGLRDAVLVPLALVDPDALRVLVEGWGGRDVQITGDPLVESASWSGAPGLGALIAPGHTTGEDGQVRVRARFRLDPPQFAELRHHAVRDARLVDSLAAGPTLELHVGLRFAADFHSLSVDPLGVAVGGVAFPVTGPERPAWLLPLLRRLRGRVCTRPLPPERWGEAASAWSATTQDHLAGAIRALADGPARVADLLPLPGEPAVRRDGRLVPLRFLPPATREAVGWVGAARLARPDVLVLLDAPVGPAWEAWWEAQVEADDAPVEQILVLAAEDAGPA